ncbi:MAG: ribosome maturation factor RimP [Saccharofermentans sp.]|nr:ribosome maturation factor RimP [Saccharofermentans sp.]
MAKRSKIAQAAFELAEPVAKEMGYDLVDAEYKKEGQDTFLRLFIDRKGGINVDDCENFSRVIDVIFDEKLTHDADYFEVSSPGLTRPLSDHADYLRYEGEKIDVNLFAEIEGMKTFVGLIKSSDKDAVTFEVEEKKTTKTVTVEYKNISKAVRHIEF